MLAGKARAYPKEEPVCALLKVRFLGLHTNNRLGWKDLPGTNALAYYENS
jgi:hypothetical protein